MADENDTCPSPKSPVAEIMYWLDKILLRLTMLVAAVGGTWAAFGTNKVEKQQVEHSQKVEQQAEKANATREVIEKKIDKVEATLYVPPDKRGRAPESKKPNP